MSQFILNKEFDELVKVTLTEEQIIGNNNINNNSNSNNQAGNKITAEDKSQKYPISFRIIKLLKEKK